MLKPIKSGGLEISKAHRVEASVESFIGLQVVVSFPVQVRHVSRFFPTRNRAAFHKSIMPHPRVAPPFTGPLDVRMMSSVSTCNCNPFSFGCLVM